MSEYWSGGLADTLFPRRRGKKRFACCEQLTNSTGNHGTASVMPARTAGIHQARRDASGDIRVNLGSGTPCRNERRHRGERQLLKNHRGVLRATTNMLVLVSV